jgi:hypothetical protein
MDIVERLKEVLKDDYGINNQEELEDAISKSKGLDIGIFTQPLKNELATNKDELKAS